MNDAKVYVIHSAKPLSELKKMLEECGGFTHIGIIYRSHRQGGNRGSQKEETKKTIAICPEKTIRTFEKSFPSYGGKIADYNWESFPFPNEQNGETWNLHISGVPNDFSVRDAEAFVVDSLKCVIKEKEGDTVNFTTEFAPRLRETGQIHGFGQIDFGKQVDHEVIKLCKLILHNTPLCFKNSSDKRTVTCVWHRSPQAGEKPTKQKSSKQKSGKSEKTDKKSSESNTERGSYTSSAKRARPAQVDVSKLSNGTNGTNESNGNMKMATKEGVVSMQN